MPLGNENLLAIWLVILWPVGLAPLAGAGDRLARIAAVLVGALVVVALGATGSFLAALAILVQILLAAVWWKRARGWLAVAVLVTLIGPETARLGREWLASGRPAVESAAPVGVPRILRRAASVVSGKDHSSRVRGVYARAGWTGLSERPLLGWGPVSVAGRPVSSSNRLRA